MPPRSLIDAALRAAQVDPRRAHWDAIYAGKAPTEVSWYQVRPTTSLRLIGRAAKDTATSVIDVGGGASRLVDALLDVGYRDVSVLDISDEPLARSRMRLGARAGSVSWIVADAARWRPRRTYDIWHDRAVFHFLVEPGDREGYRIAMAAALARGGHAIIGTFASDGPERCSGLPVVRYEPETLAAELGPRFLLLDSVHEEHLTPSGKVQQFQFSRFVKQ